MDLQKFREKVTEYRDSISMSQEELADGVGINKSVLSEALNGKRPLTPYLVRHIIRHLAKRGAILGQSQALELLNLAGCDNFSEADWNAPPLVDLAPVPSPMISLPQRLQNEAPQAPSGETTSPAEDPVSEKQDGKSQANSSMQTEEQVATAPEPAKEQAPPSDQRDDGSRGSFPTILHLQGIPLSPKDRLEAAYQQLWDISEARFQFAGVVEALRKIRGEVAYETLPRVKKELENAEAAFHENEVRQVLRFLDNNKVWPHYVLGTAAFEKHKERTKNLVEEALQPQSPLIRPVLNLDALLAGDRWKDDDPQTRKLYEEMEREFNAMLKAMNRRLRL